MFKLTFFTSSQGKLANIRHWTKDHQVEIYSFQEKTYRANYDEPRINDHEKLLKESFNDALKRWRKEHKLSEDGKSKPELHTFFIEDTSVVIHALSDKQDIPGPDIKYWMRDIDFDTVDNALKAKGNNRRVTVRSDILMYLPPALRDDSNQNYIQFTSTVDGFLVSKEYEFLTNPLYPWLDNKTFNKWFSPKKGGKPISMLPINDADPYDFRQQNVKDMLAKLNIREKYSKPELTKQLSLENFYRPPVFILCGPTCTGKTTLAEYIAQKHGYSHIEASDFMYLAFYQRHSTDSTIPIIDFAKQALSDIPHIVASQIIDHIGKSEFVPSVISGFRNVKEVNWFKDNYNESQVVTIYIDSDFNDRFKRCNDRAREDFKKNKQDFKQTDEKQKKMGLSELRSITGDAGNILLNNDDRSSLYTLFDKVYKTQLTHANDSFQKHNKKALTLEKWILLSLLNEYKTREYFTTTEISKLINQALPSDEKSKGKDNVSRYFNQKFHPYYEIKKEGRFNKYRLSNTGYSLALQIRKSL